MNGLYNLKNRSVVTAASIQLLAKVNTENKGNPAKEKYIPYEEDLTISGKYNGKGSIVIYKKHTMTSLIDFIFIRNVVDDVVFGLRHT